MTVRPPRHQQGLGRGLASLIPQRTTTAGTTDIPIARIQVNPYQPRKHMDEDMLASLAESIAEHGVIQPIIVSETLEGYRLVAGERRLRAATLAGLDHIPPVIRQVADTDQVQIALIENLRVRTSTRSRRRTPIDSSWTNSGCRRTPSPRGLAARAPRSRTRFGCSASTPPSSRRSLTAESPKATHARSAGCRRTRSRACWERW